MERTVTTARAAEIVSIGYEGLRSYLKRGLLGSSGVMPPFVGRDTPAPDLSRVRSKWTRFGLIDLCLMRLAKQLIDVGLSFERANWIASDGAVRQAFKQDQAAVMLMAWPPNYDFLLCPEGDLSQLPARLAEVGGLAVFVQLDRIRESVRSQIDHDD